MSHRNPLAGDLRTFSEIQMSFIRLPAWLALLLGATVSATAQPSSAVPSNPYRSAFEGYRNHKDEPLIPWRQANETVGRIGGWQAYAREAQGAALPSQPPASAAAAGHGSHKGRPAP
jgi:hypothetical protein